MFLRFLILFDIVVIFFDFSTLSDLFDFCFVAGFVGDSPGHSADLFFMSQGPCGSTGFQPLVQVVHCGDV